MLIAKEWFILNKILNGKNSIFNRLNSSELEKVSFFLAIIFLIMPIITIFTNLIDRTESIWWFVNQMVGYIGVILAIYVFIKSIKKSTSVKQYIKNNFIPICLFLMFILSFISTLFSSNITLSFYGTAYRCEGFITYIAYLGIFTLGFLITDKKKIFAVTCITVTVCSILSLITILQIYEFDILFNLTYDSAVFFNLNHIGYFFALSLGLNIALLLNKKISGFKFYLFLTEYIIIVIGLIKNGSFGPYLTLTVTVIALIIFSHILKHEFIFKAYIIFLVTVLITVCMSFMGYGIINDFITLFSDMKAIVSDSKDANGAGTSRWTLWKNAFDFIKEKPLLGFGPENLGFKYEAVNIMYSDRPHCEVLQYAASLGIPAALFYLAGIFKYIGDFLKSIKKLDGLEFGIVIGVLMYLFSSLFGNTMFYTTPFFFFFFGLSCKNLNSKLKKD